MIKNSPPLITKGTLLKRCHRLALILFVFCEMVFPFNVWAQSFTDTGIFSFTGSHNPLRRPIFREFLPEKGLKVGRVQLHPFVGVAEILTDNAFRTNTQRRSDTLTTIAPGIQAYVPFGGGKHSFLLDYRAAQLLYRKFTQNNVFAQHVVGHASFNFPGGLKIDLQGGNVDGFDPRGSNLDSRNKNITKWRTTNFLGQARLSGPRGSIRLRTRYARRHYKNNGQDASRDRTNAKADLTGFLNVTQAISGLLGESISNNDYDENKQIDSFSYGFFTGLALAPNRRLSGEVRVGVTILNFDRAPIEAVDPAPVPPAPLDKGNRLLNEGLSLGGKQQRRFTLRGNINWRPTTQRSINVRPFRLIRQSGVANTSTFVQTGVSLQGSQKFTNRFGLRAGFRYSNNKFSASRTDNRFRWNIGLNYRTVQWLGFMVNYYFAKRTSTDSQFKFYSNTISVSAQAFF